VKLLIGECRVPGPTSGQTALGGSGEGVRNSRKRLTILANGNQTAMAIRIGLSGWSYKDWAGHFYPPGLPQREWLGFVAEKFSTVEVNRTFYSLLRPETFQHWRQQVPPGFRFSVKGSRYITHLKRLRGVATPLANFFAAGLLELGPHLDTVLWQFPASNNVDPDDLIGFLSTLPKTTDQAVSLAKNHDERVHSFETPSMAPRPLRHAIELRHPDSLHGGIVDAARVHNVAIVMSHASSWPLFDEETADFAYVRLHGPDALYQSGYSPKQLDEWASRVHALTSERDVFVYFDNDGKGHAPRDALALMDRVPELGSVPGS
jgi:uncharacterized protein YecE (DUF72 family)